MNVKKKLTSVLKRATASACRFHLHNNTEEDMKERQNHVKKRVCATLSQKLPDWENYTRVPYVARLEKENSKGTYVL
jgi:hypothetical protein